MSKTININITEEQEKFLKLFNQDHNSNNEKNLGTLRPLFFVQTRIERVVNIEYEDYDTVKFYVPDWAESYDSEKDLIESYHDGECPIEIVSFKQAYDARRFETVEGEYEVIVSYDDYFKAYDIEDEVNVIYLKHDYQDKAFFFTRAEADRYIEYQSHNLDHPRVYACHCGYANYGEYSHFYDLLMSIGEELNSEEQVNK